MASTNFTDGDASPGNRIVAAWLNDVNAVVYGALGEATTPTAARIALGLVIGVDVQAYDADLSIWASITPGAGVAEALRIDVGDSGAFLTDADVGVTVGYINVPQNSQSAAYECVLGDQGKHIYHPSTDNNARTFTIPANASVAYAVGTCITFVNMVNTVTIAITSDTLYWALDGSTGSRTLAVYGIATALKMTSTTWLISGTGLT